MHSFDLYIHVYLIFLSNHKYLCRPSLFSLKIIQTMNSSEAPRLIDCKLDSIFHSFPREISLGHMYLSTWSVNMTTPPPPTFDTHFLRNISRLCVDSVYRIRIKLMQSFNTFVNWPPLIWWNTQGRWPISKT